MSRASDRSPAAAAARSAVRYAHGPSSGCPGEEYRTGCSVARPRRRRRSPAVTWIATERCQPAREISSSATMAVGAVPSRAIAPALSICVSNTVRPSRISFRPASLRPGGCCASYAASRALLRRPVNTEQEYPVEQIPELVLVPGDAAHEHRPVMPGQDRLHPGAAPYPAMRPEPLPVRECRAVHLMTSRVFPVRQARVVVGVNSQHAAAGQLPGKFRLPRSRIAGDKECGHKPSSQPGQAGLSGGQASGTTVFPSHSVIRPRHLGKR